MRSSGMLRPAELAPRPQYTPFIPAPSLMEQLPATTKSGLVRQQPAALPLPTAYGNPSSSWGRTGKRPLSGPKGTSAGHLLPVMPKMAPFTGKTSLFRHFRSATYLLPICYHLLPSATNLLPSATIFLPLPRQCLQNRLASAEPASFGAVAQAAKICTLHPKPRP